MPDDPLENIQRQLRRVAAVHLTLHRRHHLGDLAAAEPLGLLRHRLQRLLVDVGGDGDGRTLLAPAALTTLADAHRAQKPLRRGVIARVLAARDELIEVQAAHALASLGVGEAELEGLVHAVEHRGVEILRPVRRDDEDDIAGELAGAVEQRVERGADAGGGLGRRDAAAALREERVGFVDEQQQTAPRRGRPVEELVDPGHRVGAQRRDVTAGHERVVQAGVPRQTFRRHRLAGAGGAVEHDVTERSRVFARVGRRDGEVLDAGLEVTLEHDVAEDAARAGCGLRGGDRAFTRGGGWGGGGRVRRRRPETPDVSARLAHERRLPEVPLEHAETHAASLPRSVHADRERGDPAHERRAPLPVLQETRESLTD